MPPTNANANAKAKTLDRLKSLLAATGCGGCGSRRLKLPDVHDPLPSKPPDKLALRSADACSSDRPEKDPQPSRDPTFEPRHSDSRLAETFAVVKESDDPYLDFKHSMLQMIFEKEIFAKRDLQELLACFLRLNAPCHHDSIIRAFSEIWKAVMSPDPDSQDPTPKWQGKMLRVRETPQRR